MYFKLKNIAIFSILLTIISFFFTGCASVNLTAPPTDILTELSSGTIIIESGADSTLDCTPSLTVSCEGATYMSFSGDGASWTDWITYNSSYDGFNISNKSYGTIFGSGTKIVYAKFKNEEGVTSPLDDLAYATIYYNMPELRYFEVSPKKATIKLNGEASFTAIGWSEGKEYEVPIDGDKVTWTHCCGVGIVKPTQGLSTIYTPVGISSPCTKYITAYYEGKQASAEIVITE